MSSVRQEMVHAMIGVTEVDNLACEDDPSDVASERPLVLEDVRKHYSDGGDLNQACQLSLVTPPPVAVGK